jgi:hypothetical protein
MKKRDRGMIRRVFTMVMVFVMMTSIITIPKMTSYAAGGTVKSVTVTNLPANQLTLKKGKSFTLKHKVAVKGKISKKVAYKTSNKKVAKVSSKGKITARKKGKATITVYAKANKKKLCKIKVTVGTPVTGVTLDKASATLVRGKELTLKAIVAPAKASNKAVIWESSDTSIATVSTKGVVTTKKAGTVNITAMAKDGSGKKGTCTIKVMNPLTITSLKAVEECKIQVTLSDAYKLAAGDFAVMTKEFAAGSYRKSCTIEKVSTADNKTYTITLNKNTPLYENHYVRVKIAKYNIYKEGIYSAGVFNYISESMSTYKLGAAIEPFDYTLSGYGFSSVSVTGVPAGIKYMMVSKENTEYIRFYGTPAKAGKFTTVIKHTDELGNTYTRNITWLIYDDAHIYAASTPSYSIASSTTKYFNGKISAAGGSGSYTYTFKDGKTTASGDGYSLQLNAKRVSAKFVKAGTYKFTVIVTDAENTNLTATTEIVFNVKEGREVLIRVQDSSGNPIPKAYVRLTNKDKSNKYSSSISGYAGSAGTMKANLSDGTYTLAAGSDYYSHFRYEYSLTVNGDKESIIKLPLYKVAVALENTDIPASEYGKWYDEMGQCVGEGDVLYLEKGSYKLKMTTTGETAYNATLSVTVNGQLSVTAKVSE